LATLKGQGSLGEIIEGRISGDIESIKEGGGVIDLVFQEKTQKDFILDQIPVEAGGSIVLEQSLKGGAGLGIFFLQEKIFTDIKTGVKKIGIELKCLIEEFYGLVMLLFSM
jgi:hypothetical protein